MDFPKIGEKRYDGTVNAPAEKSFSASLRIAIIRKRNVLSHIKYRLTFGDRSLYGTDV